MLTQFVEREMEEVELKDIVEPDLMHRILTSIYGSADVVTPGKAGLPRVVLNFIYYPGLIYILETMVTTCFSIEQWFSIFFLTCGTLYTRHGQSAALRYRPSSLFLRPLDLFCYFEKQTI